MWPLKCWRVYCYLFALFHWISDISLHETVHVLNLFDLIWNLVQDTGLNAIAFALDWAVLTVKVSILITLKIFTRCNNFLKRN